MNNALTIDVADYFPVTAFARQVTWERFPQRVERNTHRLLDLFDEQGVRGTFFGLGWVSERARALVRAIASLLKGGQGVVIET